VKERCGNLPKYRAYEKFLRRRNERYLSLRRGNLQEYGDLYSNVDFGPGNALLMTVEGKGGERFIKHEERVAVPFWNERKVKRNYVIENKEHILKENRQWWKKHYERVRVYNGKYYRDYDAEIAVQSKKYRKSHMAEIRNKGVMYRTLHKSEIAAKYKKYSQSHRSEIASWQKEYRESHRDELALGLLRSGRSIMSS